MTVPAQSPSLVSVILPTFNRASFLPGAFESLIQQTHTNWELIVVDDGSSDDTRQVVSDLGRSLARPFHYVYQQNRGAYAARNRGLDEARGHYIAFFDSDDLWLPHHLIDCAAALDRHPEIDWVFGSCRQTDFATGATIDPSTFYIDGRPRPFLRLKSQSDGRLRIITDSAVVECQLSHGLYCGLQNSMMRRRLFDGRRFDSRSRVVDDEIFVIRLLAEGSRFAYFDDPHVIYRVHADNSSASAKGLSIAKHVEIYTELASSFEQLLVDTKFGPRERRALLKRLSREYFWHLGYVGYWQSGRTHEALAMFKRGLSVWPWHAGAWKTYLLARLKVALQGSS
jgi:glycosyltransferase involved in cell wall biosynthesis